MEYIQVNLSSLDTSSIYIGENRDISYKINPWEQWINYGPNNDLPYYLSSLASAGGSGTHWAILRLKKSMTCGGGFLFDKNNVKLKNFIHQHNLNKLLEDLAWERVIFNSCAIQIGREGKEISFLKNMTIPSLRVPNVEASQMNYYFISRDWRRLHEPGNQYITIPAYDSTNITANVQVMYDYTSTPNNFYYGVEDYRNSLVDINTEANLSKHQLSVTLNSMTPSGLLTIQDEPSQEAMQEFKRDVKSQYTGVENSGKVLVMFYGADKAKPEFQPLMGTNIADIYNAIKEHVKQNIMTTGGLNNPQLAGVPGGGSIFTDSLSTSFEYFGRLIVKDYQRPILSMFARIFLDAGLIQDENEISIKALSPTQFVYDKDTMDKNLLRNEIRALGGYEPIEKVSDNITERFDSNTTTLIFGIIDNTALTLEQKKTRLKIGYGLTDEEINSLLKDVEEKSNEIEQVPNEKENKESILSRIFKI